MSVADTERETVLLDQEAVERTLSRIAHEIIEGNPELDKVALVGIHTRGVPLAQRLRRKIAEFTGREVALGQLDITFYRDDVQVRGGEAPLHAQPLVRSTSLDFPLEGVTVNGRLGVIYSQDGLNNTANTQGCCCCGGNEITNCEQVNVNILAYALLY